MECVITALYEVEPYLIDGDKFKPTLCRNMNFDYYIGGLYSLNGLNKDIILFLMIDLLILEVKILLQKKL